MEGKTAPTRKHAKFASFSQPTTHGGTRGRLNFRTEAEVKRTVSERPEPSEFVGDNWDRGSRKWMVAVIKQSGKQHLGRFDDEREAACAFDTAVRRLRGDDAHGGGRSGDDRWHCLNFPSKREVGRGKALGMSISAAHGSGAVWL
eukprot:COSAG06_NODE_32318_length_508_cov_0.948655_1_plen_145_part_00